MWKVVGVATLREEVGDASYERVLVGATNKIEQVPTHAEGAIKAIPIVLPRQKGKEVKVDPRSCRQRRSLKDALI